MRNFLSLSSFLLIILTITIGSDCNYTLDSPEQNTSNCAVYSAYQSAQELPWQEVGHDTSQYHTRIVSINSTSEIALLYYKNQLIFSQIQNLYTDHWVWGDAKILVAKNYQGVDIIHWTSHFRECSQPYNKEHIIILGTQIKRVLKMVSSNHDNEALVKPKYNTNYGLMFMPYKDCHSLNTISNLNLQNLQEASYAYDQQCY